MHDRAKCPTPTVEAQWNAIKADAEQSVTRLQWYAEFHRNPKIFYPGQTYVQTDRQTKRIEYSKGSLGNPDRSLLKITTALLSGSKCSFYSSPGPEVIASSTFISSYQCPIITKSSPDRSPGKIVSIDFRSLNPSSEH